MLEPAAPREGILGPFAGSMLLHAVALALLIRLGPSGREAALERELVWGVREATPLVAPPAPAEVRLADLARRPRVFVPPPSTPPAPAPAPPVLPPPKLAPADLAALPPPAALGLGAVAPPPKIGAPEPPRMVLEKPSAGAPAPASGAEASGPMLRRPAVSLEEAIREAARSRGGGLVVGDQEGGRPPGEVSEMRSLAAAASRSASNVELLSDAQGVDFRPYLTRILATVRRNWQAVMPESARLGRRGQVAIQLSINRQGRIPKLVIAESSGAEPLDRAAVAGITASDPFPPLPEEFPGEEIRIQFNFLYNLR